MSGHLERPLAFVDLETTGATAIRDRITEIAIVTWDGERSTAWSQLLNPQTTIPPFIEKLTGISDAMVAAAPTFAEMADEIAARLQGHLFIAHNARFDYAFLKNEFRRLGRDFRAPVLCSVKYSRKLYPEHSRHNLDALIERFGLERGERHRALADARAIFQFWQQVDRSFDAGHLAAVRRELMAHPSLPPHIDAEAVDDMPDSHGVYLFYGENDLPLYVGKSNRLRQRVLAHFSADHALAKELSLSQQVRRIDWIVCAGEIEALLTESRLVKSLQPTLNQQLRRSQTCCAWTLNEGEDGRLMPVLASAGDLDLGAPGRLYGLFRTAREAHEALTGIARERGLCQILLGLEKGRAGKPCFAYQLRRCRGACCGRESILQHNIRLLEALDKLRLASWPFAGPALLQEGEVRHVIDAWCYLGAARGDEEVAALLADGRPQFDRDTYRILVRHRERLQPLIGYSRPAA